jgi:hypothetical protein
VDAAEGAVSFQVPGQVAGLRTWADDPIAGGALLQMRFKDFANAPGRIRWSEARESDSVAGVGIAGEHAHNVTVIVKLDPGQAALEAKPFSGVEFDSRGELLVAR